MPKKAAISKNQKAIEKFFKKNPGLDLETVDLAQPASLEQLDWKGLGRQKEEMTALVQAYQRLWRLLPDPDHATIIRLINTGLLGAVQIAAIPARDFFETHADVFEGDQSRMEAFYKHAVNTRSLLLQNYMNKLQR